MPSSNDSANLGGPEAHRDLLQGKAEAKAKELEKEPAEAKWEPLGCRAARRHVALTVGSLDMQRKTAQKQGVTRINAPCFQCGQVGHMKAQCPRLHTKMAAIMDAGAVSFGRVEVAPPAKQSSEGWVKPKNPVNTTWRPMPSSTTLGDYLRPKSVFTRAERIEKEDKGTVLNFEDDEDDDWVKEFEATYADMTRLKPKSKEKITTMRKGTPAKVEARLLAPLEVVYPEGAEIRAAEAEAKRAPRFKKLKVALDSGAGAHVVNREDVPGYAVRPSAMSQAGAAFLAADGGRIENHGEVHVNMVSYDTKGGAHRITSRFEAADVTRALWSVGLICDSGLDVQFTSARALVIDKQGREVCAFDRINGLYIAEVDVEIPNEESFQRRGA